MTARTDRPITSLVKPNRPRFVKVEELFTKIKGKFQSRYLAVAQRGVWFE